MESPSFNTHSCTYIADIANRVVQELHNDNEFKDLICFNDGELNEDEENTQEDEFEFPLIFPENLTDNIIYNDQIPHKFSPFGNGTIVKPEIEWSEDDEAKVCENYLAIRLLYSVLSHEIFEIIFFCDTAHDIWITLGIIHEVGNYQLKDSKINQFTQQFETFRVYDNIYSEYVRFKRIMNCLKALGKTYTNEECLERFLSALPSKWNVKVKSIRENNNLSVLSLDELIWDLQEYENNTLKKRDERREKHYGIFG